MNKVLIITSEFPPGPGGIGQHALSLVLTLHRSHQVHVLCNQDHTTEAEISEFNKNLPSNVDLHNFASRGTTFAYIRRALQALKLARENDYNYIIVSGLLPLWIGAFLKSMIRKRVHGFVHGNEVNLKKAIKARITRAAYSRLDYLYPVSSFTKSLLSSTKDTPVIKVIPNGLDHTFLSQLDKQNDFAGPSLKGAPALLTVGNVTLRKGQHRVIRALPEVLKKYPEAHYHIVGLPTRKEEFKSLATELGVAHAVTFHGRLLTRKELFVAYKSADIFVMLSENQPDGDVEGFGIAILEANALGVPAIGATGCGIEDAISSENGLLVDGDKAGEVLNAIEVLLADKPRYQQGAKTWAQQHDWRELVKQIVE